MHILHGHTATGTATTGVRGRARATGDDGTLAAAVRDILRGAMTYCEAAASVRVEGVELGEPATHVAVLAGVPLADDVGAAIWSASAAEVAYDHASPDGWLTIALRACVHPA